MLGTRPCAGPCRYKDECDIAPVFKEFRVHWKTDIKPNKQSENGYTKDTVSEVGTAASRFILPTNTLREVLLDHFPNGEAEIISHCIKSLASVHPSKRPGAGVWSIPPRLRGRILHLSFQLRNQRHISNLNPPPSVGPQKSMNTTNRVIVWVNPKSESQDFFQSPPESLLDWSNPILKSLPPWVITPACPGRGQVRPWM